LIRRLRGKRRIDTIPNDLRSRRSRAGKWIYLTLLFTFFLWIADLFVGPMLRLEADGLVVAEYVSVGVPFAAQVEAVTVTPGASIRRGDTLARVTSVDLAVSIANLTAQNAELLTKRAEVERRARIAEAVLPIARDRAQQADHALDRIRDVRESGNVSLATWSQALAERFVASERVAELQAEARTTVSNLQAVNDALTDAMQALKQLNGAYAGGVVAAPVDGIVGISTARPGDVLTVGEPLMLLYRPQRYVLAYLATGTLYSVIAGDEVRLSDGFVQTEGRVVDVLPVTEQVPEEFRKALQPRDRGQMARVALAADDTFPLFARVKVTGVGWLSPGSIVRVWIDRIFRASNRTQPTPEPSTPRRTLSEG
jgi:multidrug resistance efflux pump